VSEFGELRGLIGLKPQKQLEIQPYALGQIDTFEEEEGNPFRDGTDVGGIGVLKLKDAVYQVYTPVVKGYTLIFTNRDMN